MIHAMNWSKRYVKGMRINMVKVINDINKKKIKELSRAPLFF